ncbi:unnamed protein product, partial [Brassica oleracea var. botrytis]
AELNALLWSVESLASHHLDNAWSVDFVKTLRNLTVLLIANSVTSDNRHQSYVASGGPFWLHNLLQKE